MTIIPPTSNSSLGTVKVELQLLQLDLQLKVGGNYMAGISFALRLLIPHVFARDQTPPAAASARCQVGRHGLPTDAKDKDCGGLWDSWARIIDLG